MRDLDGLIEKIEGLERPSRDADEAIWEAIGDWPALEYRSCDYMKAFGTPVTASLDAATALVERVLSGFGISVEAHPVYGDWWDAAIFDQMPKTVSNARKQTAALAMCLALLRAIKSGSDSLCDSKVIE